jgi:hypothetical protein
MYPPRNYYRRFCKEFNTWKMKTNKIMKGWKVLNLRRRTDNYSECSIESAAHTQILKQQ